MIEAEQLAGLDAAGVLDRVEAARAAVADSEFDELALAVHWIDLHAPADEAEAKATNRSRRRRGRERYVASGAEGTPLVAEFAVSEFGAVGGRAPLGARRFLSDAVNIRYRHPRLWQALADGQGRVWQAREIVGMCLRAGLTITEVGWVDAVTTPYLATLSWSRFVALVEAKIIEADPHAAAERARAAAMARFVRTGRANEHGIRSVYARAEAGDAVCFTAMVDRIAHLLAEHGDTDPVPVLRSKALGILATPARALKMLLDAAADDHQSDGADGADGADDHAADDHAADDHGAADGAGTPDGDAPHSGGPDGDGPDSSGGGSAGDPDVVGEADVHPSQNDADEPAGMRGDPNPFTTPGARQIAAALAKIDPRKLLPQATLYVHLSQDALSNATNTCSCSSASGAASSGAGAAVPAVGRVEGLGPVTVDQVAAFLGHRDVRVVPVLDVAGQAPVDGYEAPDRMREALHLRHPACAFPYATHLGRKHRDTDHNHVYVPMAAGGPPGQTNLGNLASLTRFPHRLKTHGGWQLRQPVPGVYLWRSPHGYWWRVDHLGTHRLGRETIRGHPPVQEWHSPVETDFSEYIAKHRHRRRGQR